MILQGHKLGIKNYLTQVDKIGNAIQHSDGTIKNIMSISNLSRAGIYRYILIEPKLKQKYLEAKMRVLELEVRLNKELIKRHNAEFYKTREVKKILRDRKTLMT